MTRRQLRRLHARAMTLRNRSIEIFWDVEALLGEDDENVAPYASGVVTSASELVVQIERSLDR